MNTFLDSEIEKREINRQPRHTAPGQERTLNRIWIVDDDRNSRLLLARLLNTTGAIVCSRAFATPDSLLAALKCQTAPDTILLDIQLGERQGVDFIQPIKALARGTRILILTTSYDPPVALHALQAGASAFVLKCAAFSEIVARILEGKVRPKQCLRPAVFI
jgi:DNA-binding NarL/FixJ family response regulator